MPAGQSIDPKSFNDYGKYIWKIMQKRRPDDTLYALAKRINVRPNTLYKQFRWNSPFSQAILLMRICSDLGISMEEVILMEPVKDSGSKEAEKWKEKYFQAEKEKTELKKQLDKISGILKDK